ncbi:MAG: Fe-S cluster assembly protein SufD [Gammaproteobacteria bacterium]|jgi:Fe-S cluster assembly protein SufD
MSKFAENLSEQFRAFSGDLPGSAHTRIADARKRAFEEFSAVDVPNLKVEDWKYTDISAIRDGSYTAIPRAADAPALDLDAVDLPEFTPLRAVFVDGRYSAALSTLTELPDSIALDRLAELLAGDTADLVPHLEMHDAPFVALNSAFVADGVHMTIADGCESAEAIHVLFVNTAAADQRLTTVRLIVNAGRNSRCTVVESHFSLPGASGLTNALTELDADDGASITHYRLQVDDAGTHHIGNVAVAAAHDATVETCSFAFGGGITRIDVNADLTGSGASVALNGLFMANGHQHIDHHTRIRHLVGNTHSSENYKGIADGNGRGVFNGKIYVAENAQKIEALQSSKNLLLSEGAEIDTKPELEIYADDVKCAHGATVGQLDEDAFFYLRSRGVDQHTARSILTFAFAADIAASVSIDPLREWIERRIRERTHATGINEIDNHE